MTTIRRCDECGCEIDPVDWCGECMKGVPCRAPHRTLRKRADAKFCSDHCRNRFRKESLRIRKEVARSEAASKHYTREAVVEGMCAALGMPYMGSDYYRDDY